MYNVQCTRTTLHCTMYTHNCTCMSYCRCNLYIYCIIHIYSYILHRNSVRFINQFWLTYSQYTVQGCIIMSSMLFLCIMIISYQVLVLDLLIVYSAAYIKLVFSYDFLLFSYGPNQVTLFANFVDEIFFRKLTLQLLYYAACQ